MLDETAKNLDGVVVSTPDPIHAGALLGAIRRGKPGEKLEWNGPTMQFKNSIAANAYLRHTYRQGWSLRG